MNSTKQTQVKTIIFGILGLSLAYAITRYQIFGSVPWKDLPFYILNKAISMSAFILLVLSLSLSTMQKMRWSIARGLIGSRAILTKSSFLLLLIHLLMSFLLFSSSNYEKFFVDDGSLTLYAGLSMLGGVVAFVILWSYQSDGESKNFDASVTFLLLFLLAMHLYFMGYEGWIDYANWYGSMPPISLVAFVLLLFAFIIRIKKFVTDA